MNVTTFPVKIDGHLLHFQPDSGSLLTIISRKDYDNYCASTNTNQELKPVTKTFRAFNNSIIPFDGYFKAILASASTEIKDKIFVSKSGNGAPPILSETALLQLGLMAYDSQGGFVKKTSQISKPAISNKIQDPVYFQKFEDLHSEFADVFHGIGCLKNYEADLQLSPDAKPFTQRAAPCPHHLRKLADQRLDEFVANNIFKEVPSDYPIKFCTRMLVLPKLNKPNEVRIVGSFQQLNQYLDRTAYVPSTRIEDFMMKMNGAKYFIKTDMKLGYHQIRLSKKSQDYCIVSTYRANYFHLRLPMGLLNSGDEFDRCVQLILSGCQHTICSRDDVLCGHATLSGLFQEWRKVLTALRKSGLTLDGTKTFVGMTSLEFFGIVFNEHGVHPSPKKVQALKQATRPINQKGVLSFICFAGWNARFIPRFSEMVQPLRELSLTKGKMVWEPKHETSFQLLKNALCDNAMNYYFQVGLPTAIFTDAGKIRHDCHEEEKQPGCLSAILAQQDPETNEWKPCQYSSRALTKPECSYGQIELEALAIKNGIQKFHWFCYGSPQKTIIFTDCKPLISLFNTIPKTCPPRIMRIILSIQDVPYVVRYFPGKFLPSDFLSRSKPLDQPTNNDFDISDELEKHVVNQIKVSGDKVCLNLIREETAKDEELQFLIQRMKKGDFRLHKKHEFIQPYLSMAHEISEIDGLVMRGERIIILPQNLRNVVLQKIHSLAHSGEDRLMALMKEYFWFPQMWHSTRLIIQSCDTCQRLKRDPRREPYQIAPLPDQPYQEIAIDFKDLSNGKKALVFCDLFTRYPDCSFVSTTSMAAIRKPLLKYFAYFQTPYKIVSDGGPPFNSSDYQNFADECGFEIGLITPKNPSANGILERLNATIGMADLTAQLEHKNIEESILMALKVYRATIHPALGMSPYEALFGRKMNLGNITIAQTAINRNVDYKKTEDEARFETVAKRLYANKLETKSKHDKEKNVKPHDFRVNDRVLVIDDLQSKMKKKLYMKDIYQITKIKGVSITAISLTTGRVIKRHSNHFKRYIEPIENTLNDEEDDNNDALRGRHGNQRNLGNDDYDDDDDEDQDDDFYDYGTPEFPVQVQAPNVQPVQQQVQVNPNDQVPANVNADDVQQDVQQHVQQDVPQPVPQDVQQDVPLNVQQPVRQQVQVPYNARNPGPMAPGRNAIMAPRNPAPVPRNAAPAPRFANPVPRRNVQFAQEAEVVEVERYLPQRQRHHTRSRGQAANLPNVLPAQPERSASLRRQLSTALRRHEQNTRQNRQQNLRLDNAHPQQQQPQQLPQQQQLQQQQQQQQRQAQQQPQQQRPARRWR